MAVDPDEYLSGPIFFHAPGDDLGQQLVRLQRFYIDTLVCHFPAECNTFMKEKQVDIKWQAKNRQWRISGHLAAIAITGKDLNNNGFLYS